MISGKFLTAAADGANIDGTHEWSCEEVADKLDGTTGADRGRGNPEGGVIDTNITIAFYLDIVAGKWIFIRTGAILTDLQLFANLDDAAPMYQISSAEVGKILSRVQVRDKYVITCDIWAKGDVVSASDPI